jgi:SAM-dependent methyltransferase
MSDKKYREIGVHYENCLEEHGDSHLGVDWLTHEGAVRRYDVLIEFITQKKDSPVKVLDFGCGFSGLWERIIELGVDVEIEYTGIDINQKYVDLSREKFPKNNYICVDILSDDAGDIGKYDYVLLNGLFTQKMSLTNNEMASFFGDILVKLFSKTKVGLMFNCMSPIVDYKKDGAFHLEFDSLSKFLAEKMSRKFVIRHDVFPYEYFCGVYK